MKTWFRVAPASSAIDRGKRIYIFSHFSSTQRSSKADSSLGRDEAEGKGTYHDSDGGRCESTKVRHGEQYVSPKR